MRTSDGRTISEPVIDGKCHHLYTDVKHARQLALFAPSPAVFSARFIRWSRKIDELRICSRCEREIILKARGRNGEVVGEFMLDGRGMLQLR